MRKIIFLFLLFLFSMQAQKVAAVPAVPWPVEKIQPDGSKITVYLRGDERVHWMESMDGYTLMYDSERNIVYAQLDTEDNLIPSQVKAVGSSALRSSEVNDFLARTQRKLRYSKTQLQVLNQIWEAGEKIQKAPAAPIGERKALCVLMNFTDKTMVKTKEEFELLMNQVGYNAGSAKGSVKDFYRENSYGQLDLTVTVAGPYTTEKTQADYLSQGNNYSPLQAFATEAATRAAEDLDLADYAENGTLETFHIIFAGYGDEAIQDGNQIWSHKFNLALPITLDGISVYTYSCSPELRGSFGTQITSIGVICHELCHVFGSPDYYDTGSSGFHGTGQWDLMANGSWNDEGDLPAHINIFQKILYGWVTPVELNQPTEIRDMPNSTENAVAYTVKANPNGEMYVLENKQQIGFDAAVPGHGLLIYHVHQNAYGGWASNASHPQNVYPVCAVAPDAIPTNNPSSYGPINSPNTPFGETSKKTQFTNYTVPQMFSWATRSGAGKPIKNIVESDQKISFDFMPQSLLASVTDLTASVSDGNVTLSWTASSDEVFGYYIYRNNELVATILDETQTTFTQWNLLNGDYNYTVVVFAEDAASDPVPVSVTVTESSDDVSLPVTDLIAIAETNKVNLSWEAPLYERWTGYHQLDNINYGMFGLASTAIDFDIAIRWAPGDLAAFDGMEVSRIRFLAPGAGQAVVAYSARVWTGGDASAPDKLVVDQPVTASIRPNAWININLKEPVKIDASQELWIGLRCNTTEGAPAPISIAEETVDGKGNMIYSEETGWGSLRQLFGAEFEGNWIIDAYVRVSDGSVTPKAVEYKIYRGGIEVGTTQTTSFSDTNLSPGTTYVYNVSAVNGYGYVSEGVCVSTRTLGTGSSLDNISSLPIIAYPNPTQDVVRVRNASGTIRLYNMVGTLLGTFVAAEGVETIIDLSPYAKGTYYLHTNGKGLKVIRK